MNINPNNQTNSLDIALWEKQLYITPDNAKKFIYSKQGKGFTAIKEWFSITANRIMHYIIHLKWLNNQEIFSFVKSNYGDLKNKTFQVLTQFRATKDKKEIAVINTLYQKTRPLFKVFKGTALENQVREWTNYWTLKKVYKSHVVPTSKGSPQQPIIIDNNKPHEKPANDSNSEKQDKTSQHINDKSSDKIAKEDNSDIIKLSPVESQAVAGNLILAVNSELQTHLPENKEDSINKEEPILTIPGPTLLTEEKQITLETHLSPQDELTDKEKEKKQKESQAQEKSMINPDATVKNPDEAAKKIPEDEQCLPAIADKTVPPLLVQVNPAENTAAKEKEIKKSEEEEKLTTDLMSLPELTEPTDISEGQKIITTTHIVSLQDTKELTPQQAVLPAVVMEYPYQITLEDSTKVSTTLKTPTTEVNPPIVEEALKATVEQPSTQEPPRLKIDLLKNYENILNQFEAIIENQTWKKIEDRAKELDNIKKDFPTGAVFSGIKSVKEFEQRKAFVIKMLTDALEDQKLGENIVQAITNFVDMLMDPEVKKDDRKKVKNFLELVLKPVDNKSPVDSGQRMYIITKFLNNLIHMSFYQLDDYANMHNELALVKKCETSSKSWGVTNWLKSAAQTAANIYIEWRKGLIAADLTNLAVLKGKGDQVLEMINILFPFFTTLMWADRDNPPTVKVKAKLAMEKFQKSLFKDFIGFDIEKQPTKAEMTDLFVKMFKELTKELKPKMTR